MSNRFERPDDVEYLRIHDTEAGGWVRDGVIGFRGFVNERDALRAAALCHALLTEWLDDRPPALRLLRPFPVRGVGARSFGFELSLPAPRQSALRLARQLHDTLAALQQPHDDESPGPPDNAA